MTIKLAVLRPDLASTQVSRWFTRDISTLRVNSSPQKFGDDFVTFWYESARNSTSSLLCLYIGASSTAGNVVMAGSTNQYSYVSPWWTEYNSKTNTPTFNGYARAGNHNIGYLRLGIPNTTQIDLTWSDSSNSTDISMIRFTKSTGAIATQVTSGSLSGTYSSGGPQDIVYEGGGGPTLIAALYRTSVSAQTGVVIRFNSDLTVAQSAYFYANLNSVNGTIPYAGAYCPGATNALLWGGQHDNGNRIIGSISGGMGGAGLADMFEYGNSYVQGMASPTTGTTFFAAGGGNSAAGQTSCFLSKHDASNFQSVAPTTRTLYKASAATYGYSCVYDQTNDFVYVCGYTSDVANSVNNGVGFVAKFVASTMTIVWQREFFAYGRESYFWNIKLDANKNLIIAGESDSAGVLMGYDASGPTGVYRYTPNNNTNEEIVFEIRAGSMTVGSPSTVVSSRSYTTFAAPSISFGTSTNYTKQGTNPSYTSEKIKI